MAAAYAAGAANLPFGVLRGYRGGDLPARTRVGDRRPARSRARSWRRCRRTARMSGSSTPSRPTGTGNVQLWGILGVQKEAVLARARSIVTVEEVVDELDAGAGRDRAAGLGRSAPSLSRRAARIRRTRTATTTATTTSTARWDAISRDRDAFRAWMDEHVLERRVAGRECDAYDAPDEMMAVEAARRPRRRHGLLRRHRPAEPRREPRAPDARARLRARLRERHDRREAGRAAALDRRRRAGGDRGRGRLGAGDVRVLAPGRPHRRRLPRRRADRPARQPQQHRDRRLRPSRGAPARRRRRARDRDSAYARCSSCCASRRARSSSSSTSRRALGDRVRVVVTDLGVLEPRDGELTLDAGPSGRDRRAGARGDRLGAARRGRRSRDRAADRRGAARSCGRSARKGTHEPDPYEGPVVLPDDPSFGPEVQVDYPGYRSTRWRAPKRPLVTLPEELHVARRARVRRGRARRARQRPHAPARRRAARRADRRHRPRARRGRPAGARRARRGVAGERGRPLQARGRPAPGAARPELLRRRPLPHRRRRPLPLRHGQARLVPVGEPRERVAAGAHPLLGLRPRCSRSGS